VGWSISGLSSIDACASTVVQDGVIKGVDLTSTTANRFCIDGNRLRVTSGSYGASGSTYQTEIADFSRVTAYGGSGITPDHFVVQGKDGLSYEYGNTTDSKDTLGSSSIYRWLLNRVSDRSGNSYVLTYNNQGHSSTVIASISWSPISAGASSYQYKASFNYSQKSDAKDILSGYVGGTNYTNANKLDSVVIGYSASGSGHTAIRQYVLTYETSSVTSYSRLKQIQECAASASDCLSPNVMAYQLGQNGVSDNSGFSLPNGLIWLRKLDFNGDGKSDIAFVSNGTWRVALSTGSGFGTAYDTGIPSGAREYVDRFVSGNRDGFLYVLSNVWTYVGFNGSGFTSSTTGITAAADGYTQIADADGDGLADIVSISGFSGGGTTITVQKNITSGSATAPSFSSTGTTSAGPTIYSAAIVLEKMYPPAGCYKTRLCDLNGDGGGDLALFVGYQPQGTSNVYYNAYSLISSGGTGYGAGQIGSDPNYLTYTGIEFNDDKCTDRIVGTVLTVSSCGNAAGYTINLPAQTVATMDWDGDGRADLLVPNGSTLGVYLSKGSTTSPFSGLITTSIPYSSTNSYFAFDMDGDGLDDLAIFNISTGVTYYKHTGASGGFNANAYATQTPDLLTSVTDGFGNITTAGYVSTGYSSSFYTPGTGTALPLKDSVAPLIVVG